MSSQPYFNTTSMTGDDLRTAITCASNQDDAVLQVYRNAHGPLSPSAVWNQLQQAGWRCPLTSVRRSICTLTFLGELSKTDQQSTGLYGRPEHQWRVAA